MIDAVFEHHFDSAVELRAVTKQEITQSRILLLATARSMKSCQSELSSNELNFATEFDFFEVNWIERAMNSEADALATEAMQDKKKLYVTAYKKQ